MKRALELGLFLLLSVSTVASASERRSRLDSDECSRQAEVCERLCDDLEGMDRLSCKTDCRLEETQCRNGGRR
jgi:hypothetical protein